MTPEPAADAMSAYVVTITSVLKMLGRYRSPESAEEFTRGLLAAGELDPAVVPWETAVAVRPLGDDAGTPEPSCPVCRDTGIVQCPETNPEDGVYEQACPEKVHDGPRDIGARRAAELFAKSDNENENWLGI